MGIVAAIISALFATSKDLLSKSLATRVDSTISTFASFVYALPFYAVLLGALGIAGYEPFELGGQFVLLVLARSITDCLAEWSKMAALSLADISLLASILSLSPVFLLILAPLIGGDSIGWLGSCGVVLVVIGSITAIYRPHSLPGPRERKGIALALMTALFFALNTCFDKLAVQRSTPVLAGATMTALAAVFFVPFLVMRRQHAEQLLIEQRRFWLRGFFELLFMVSKLIALQFLPAPYVMALLRLSLLFSIIGGRMAFREEAFARRILGGLIVLAGVCCIILEL